MLRDFSEREWKIFRRLSKVALNRFCAHVLSEIGEVSADESLTHHQRYLKVYHLTRDRDRELADAFDGLSRSKALWQLRLIFELGLITDDELALFSESTREFVTLSPPS